MRVCDEKKTNERLMLVDDMQMTHATAVGAQHLPGFNFSIHVQHLYSNNLMCRIHAMLRSLFNATPM